MTKTDLTFAAFSLRFVDFTVQFSFRYTFSFNEERPSSQVWQWRHFLRDWEIASFCKYNRSLQMAFFVFAKVVKGRLSRYVERFWNKKASLFCYYIKQIDSMLPCVCLVTDHRRYQNVEITSVPLFSFLPQFGVFCDLLLNRRTATSWNPFVKLITL